MKRAETTINELNELNIFTSNDFTYYEYVDQLTKFQDYITKRALGARYHKSLRLDDAIHELKMRAIQSNIQDSHEYFEGLNALKEIQKELAISASGKKGEDKVDQLLTKYVSRPDYANYRGIYLDDGIENTEIDNVILTKDGFVLLEVKNIKTNIKISEEGRMFYGRDCSYEEATLAEKMERKRNLFKKELKKAVKEKGFCIDIIVDSYVVFNEPYKANYRIIDDYHEEPWCKSNGIAYKINNHESSVQYTNHEFEILNECLQEMETCKKTFITDLDLEAIKYDVAILLEKIEQAEETNAFNQQPAVDVNLLKDMSASTSFGSRLIKLASLAAIAFVSLTTSRN